LHFSEVVELKLLGFIQFLGTAVDVKSVAFQSTPLYLRAVVDDGYSRRRGGLKCPSQISQIVSSMIN
jgi:hypothetical protein